MTAPPCSGSGVRPVQKTALLVAPGNDASGSDASGTDPSSDSGSDRGIDINGLLSSVLATDGWSIRRAVDNHHALALAIAEPFDLIITGRKMLGPEDVELLREIRSARAHVRLIILADRFTPGDVISAVREGAFSYFSAPFHAAELADMVRAAMASPCWDDGLEILSATPEWVRVAARCDMSSADRLVQFLRGVRDPDIPEGIISAFREVLLNAMEYGAHFDPSQHVEISFIRARRMVACRVKDPGHGFSLEELRHAAINNPPDDLLSHFAVREAQGLRPGGFGLLLAKKLVDELIYSQQGNEVLLVKYVDPPIVSQVAP